MADVKISQLPEVSSLNIGDVLPAVAGIQTSKITLQNLANTLPQVSSSISASYAGSSISSSYADNTISSSYAISASFAINAPKQDPFPYTGSAIISGSLGITGSVSLSYLNGGSPINTFVYSSTNGQISATGSLFGNATTAFSATSASYANTATSASYANTATSASYSDTATSASYSITTSYALSANVPPTFPYTGSAIISGSLGITGSLNLNSLSTNNQYTLLTQVSKSLSFADDAAAAAGGVPLGGLYRSGNFVLIRLV